MCLFRWPAIVSIRFFVPADRRSEQVNCAHTVCLAVPAGVIEIGADRTAGYETNADPASRSPDGFACHCNARGAISELYRSTPTATNPNESALFVNARTSVSVRIHARPASRTHSYGAARTHSDEIGVYIRLVNNKRSFRISRRRSSPSIVLGSRSTLRFRW